MLNIYQSWHAVCLLSLICSRVNIVVHCVFCLIVFSPMIIDGRAVAGGSYTSGKLLMLGVVCASLCRPTSGNENKELIIPYAQLGLEWAFSFPSIFLDTGTCTVIDDFAK